MGHTEWNRAFHQDSRSEWDDSDGDEIWAAVLSPFTEHPATSQG